MVNKPGISWGVKNHVNLLRLSKRWIAIYYDSEKSVGEIIKIFNPKNYYEYFDMIKTVTTYNYNTCNICPVVKSEIDATE